ncbi:MAG: sensor histidine kinase [Tumebacillaceae bacterium]
MRYTIRTKLILSYLLIVLVTLSISGMLFYAMIKSSVQQQALDTLEGEGQTFIKTLQEQGSLEEGNKNINRDFRLSVSLASRSVLASYVVVKPDQTIFSTNMTLLKKRDRFPLVITRTTGAGNDDVVKKQFTFRNQQFLLYATPIPSTNGLTLIMLAPLQVVHDVIVDLIGQLVKGFLITSAVVFVIGLWLSRSLTKPVLLLGKQMKRLAKRDFSPPPVVQTGDEYELLSRTFANMVEELKRYDQGQRRFLQNASHELKTPLMSIQGYAEGIKDGIFRDEEALAGLDVISKESMRLKKLVDELIYLSKLETLEDVYNQTEQDFAEIAVDSLERLKSLALQKSIELKLTGKGPFRIRVDRDKMMQTLINLLSNGIRHARNLVETELRQEDTYLHVIIRDDGEGFTGPQEQIFERFYKGDKGDTGLGLAIVKAIIEKSGGTIRAQNSARGGAEFHIMLPLL